MGYFVTGLASDEPDPVAFLALSGSQPRAAISVEPVPGPEPAIQERACALRASRSVPNREDRSDRGAVLCKRRRCHPSETWCRTSTTRPLYNAGERDSVCQDRPALDLE